MTATREAIALPLVFLTVTLLGGLRIADGVALLPPPLFALVLSVLLLGLLVRCGAFAPNRLVHASRSTLANVNGLIVMLAAFLASAQAFNVATPESGAPRCCSKGRRSARSHRRSSTRRPAMSPSAR